MLKIDRAWYELNKGALDAQNPTQSSTEADNPALFTPTRRRFGRAASPTIPAIRHG